MIYHSIHDLSIALSLSFSFSLSSPSLSPSLILALFLSFFLSPSYLSLSYSLSLISLTLCNSTSSSPSLPLFFFFPYFYFFSFCLYMSLSVWISLKLSAMHKFICSLHVCICWNIRIYSIYVYLITLYGELCYFLFNIWTTLARCLHTSSSRRSWYWLKMGSELQVLRCTSPVSRALQWMAL